MIVFFYISIIIAILSTLMVITQKNAVHALLYLIVSFLAIAVIIYLSGSPFVAALEILIYAGAIMTLFIFVVMMLNLGPITVNQEKKWLSVSVWIGPTILALILLTEIIIVFIKSEIPSGQLHSIGSKEIGFALFTKFLPAVELTGMLLLAGIIGAFHLGKKKKKNIHRYLTEIEKL